MNCRDISTSHLRRTRLLGVAKRWWGMVMAFALPVMGGTVMAQTLSTYTFSESAGSYAALGGTAATGAVSDDESANGLSIGFSFQFGPNTYTTISVNANGWMRLGGTIPGSPWTNNATNWTAATFRPLLAPVWDDNHSGVAGATVTYNTTGSAGSRVFTVDYNNVRVGGTGATGGGSMYYQVKLYETTNVIEFIYGAMTTTNAVTATIGISDASGFHSVTPGATGTSSTTTANHAISATVLAFAANKKYTFTPLPPCAGQPNAGTASGPSAACMGGVANLTATGLSIGVGLSLQWEESPDGSTGWASVVGGTGATTSAYTTSAFTGTRYFRIRSACSQSGLDNVSNVITVGTVVDQCQCGAYFAATATADVDEDISNVTVGTLNNSSTCASVAPGPGSVQYRYGNYTTSVAAPDLERGSVVNFSLTQTTCNLSNNYANFFQLYIDWNQNGTFEVGERMFNQPTSVTGNHTQTGTFAVPMDAVLGSTRMRVVVIEAASSATNYAQQTFSWGEVEDYCVNVTTAPVCDSQPAAATASGPGTVCYGAGATVTATGITTGTGITYQWEQSLDGGATWGVVEGTGGDSPSCTTSGITSTRVLRFKTVCSLTSEESVSNEITVSGTLLPLPYTQNFATGTPPACWSNPLEVGGEVWLFANTPLTGNYPATVNDPTPGNTRVAWIDASGDILANQLRTPFLDMGAASSVTVGFKVLSNNTTNAIQHTLTMDVWDGAAWVRMITYADNNANWVSLSAIVPDGIPSTTQFRIVAERDPAGISGDYFYNDLFIDDFYVIETPTCEAPTGVAASNVLGGSADISWTCTSCTGQYIVEYGLAGFTPGTGGTAGVGGTIWTGAPVAGSPVTITGLDFASGSGYRVFVREVCPGDDHSSNSVSAFMGYCIPTVSNVGDHITGFSTTNGVVNISNPSGSPASAGNYGNFTAMVVSAVAEETFNYNLAYAGGTNGIKVWVDWNNDLVFDDGTELMSTAGPAASPQNGTVTVPGGTPLGNYRMRVRAAWNAVPVDACGLMSYGETEDYTLSVVPPPSCLPPTGVNAGGITVSSAEVGWTCTSCTGQYIVEYGLAGFTPGTDENPGVGGTIWTGAPVAGSPVTITGLDENTAYQVYVREVCPGDDYSVNTTVLAFRTACEAFPVPFQEGFNSASTTESCWRVLNVNGDGDAWDLNYNLNVYEGDQVAALYTDINAGANDDWLISPAITLTGNEQLRFRYRVQSATEPNDFRLMLSTTGIAPGDFTEVLLPLASYSNTTYMEQTIDLSAYTGDVHIGWHVPPGGLDGWRIYIDDVNVEPQPPCMPPSSLTLVSASTTSLSASWTGHPTATSGYNWEVRTSGAAGSGPTGRVDMGSTMGTSFSTGVALASNTSHSVYVQSDCDENGTSTWIGPLALFTGYCAATAIEEDDAIIRVQFANVDNSPSGTGWAGYQDWSAQVGYVTTGVPVAFSVEKDVFYTGDELAIWIDLNNDMTFGAGERVFYGDHLTNPLTGTFTVPNGTPSGAHRMRIRSNWDAAPPACGTTTYGEVEDYTVWVCTLTATAQVNDVCGDDEFFVEFTSASIGTGTVEYTVSGGAVQTQAFTGVGTLLGPFPESVMVNVRLVDGGCSVDLGDFGSSCPIDLDCEAPALLFSHCYDNGDTRTWTWVNNEVDGTVALKFVSGSLNVNDEVQIWEGNVGGTLASTLTGSLTGMVVNSVGGTLSMSIVTDGTGSCTDGGVAGGWVFQARCGGCTEPFGEVLTDVNFEGLPAEVDCGADPATFNAYAFIYDNGVNGTTGDLATTVGYRLWVNGVQQPDVTGLPGLFDTFDNTGTNNPYLLGTFPLATALNVMLLHADQATQSSCNSTIATNFTVGYSACPPDNDEQANATVLTVNTLANCPANAVTGTTRGASQSGAQPSCAAGAVQDVWYAVDITGHATPRLSVTDGTATVVGLELFLSDMTPHGYCTTDITQFTFLNMNGLTPGVYYARLFTTEAGAGSFSVCVSSPGPAGYECNGAISIPSLPVTNQALVCSAEPLPGLLNSTTVPVGCGATAEYYGGQEALYTFTPTVSGPYVISYAGQTWSAIMVYANACPTNGGTCVGGVGSSAASKFVTLTLAAGTTYYLWFDTYPTPDSPCAGTFSIRQHIPPANDACASAVELTVNPDYLCGTVTAGTVLDATPSGNPLGSCSGGPDDDVWYSFVATHTAHRVSLMNVVGSLTDMYMKIYRGDDCGSLVDVACSDPNDWNGTGLTVGARYYVRVYTFTTTGGQNTTFNICVGTPPPPPVNDNCAGATVLGVNPDMSCAAQTAGTMMSATNSGVAVAPCTGTPNDDVWYSFTATEARHIITVSSVSSGTLYMQLFSGACGTLSSMGCSTVLSYTTPNTLVPGDVYYVRVYGSTATALSSTFNICVTTPPAGPPANDECAGATGLTVNTGTTCTSQTFGTVFGATNSGLAVSPCTGTADDDVWYSFVATANPSHVVSLNSVTGSVTSMNVQVFSGACGSLTSIGCGVAGTTSATTLFGLMSGTTYYVRVYTNTATGGQNTTFNICVTTPPAPANDECANATSLTVNPNYSCGSFATGTVLGATPSGNPLGSCFGGPDDDVWYSFVATNTAHRVSLTNVVGSVTDMYMKIYRGEDCGSLVDVACSDPNDWNGTGLTVGARYYVRVYTYSATSGQNTTFNICVGTPPPAPAYDVCGGAEVIPSFGPFPHTTAVLNNTDATMTGDPTNSCQATVRGGVWFRFTPGWSGSYTISSCQSDVPASTMNDNVLAIFTSANGCVGPFTQVACDDDGCTTLTLQAIVTTTLNAGTTYYIVGYGYDANAGAIALRVTAPADPSPCTENVTVDLRTDVNSAQASWEILEQNSGLVRCQFTVPVNGITTPITENCCLPVGCYRLRVMDSGGDGFVTGGYQLRESGSNGRRIIDNLGNFNSGSLSAIRNTYDNGAFCVPVGDDKLIFSSCDKVDWVPNKFIVVAENPAVSAQFGVSNANSGYEFWFFDPNGTYSFRRFRSHSTSDGFGTGALRANHFKINGWTNSVATPHLPANVLLNVRIRGRVAGTNLPFGQACLFKIDASLAACPRVKLQDDPANPSDFSCGVSRNFGGSSSAANRIYANPPQPVPTVASNQVRYQFRFRIPGEGICIVRPPQTSAQVVLNWTNGPALEASKTYQVDVRVSLNAGSTWCFGPTGTSQAAACADTEDWGKVCNVTINSQGMSGGANSMAVAGSSTFTMYPNPNRGDQLFLSLSSVEEGVSTVHVDIFDLTGKRVVARTIATQDGFVNTNLEIDGDLAAGLYMVHVAAGSKTYTERLVIQP